ncbi:ENV1 protein, partial [Vireo altiloquus]|nr:ENV1 protein [Vireo altiloquus]
LPTNSLWDLLKGVYSMLNRTSPEITKHCWLCYDVRPPFYEAIGIPERFQLSNLTNPPECSWGETKSSGITLTSVKGRGKCIG